MTAKCGFITLAPGKNWSPSHKCLALLYTPSSAGQRPVHTFQFKNAEKEFGRTSRDQRETLFFILREPQRSSQTPAKSFIKNSRNVKHFPQIQMTGLIQKSPSEWGWAGRGTGQFLGRGTPRTQGKSASYHRSGRLPQLRRSARLLMAFSSLDRWSWWFSFQWLLILCPCPLIWNFFSS